MDTDRDTRAKSKTTFYDGCVNGMIHRATFQSHQLEDFRHQSLSTVIIRRITTLKFVIAHCTVMKKDSKLHVKSKRSSLQFRRENDWRTVLCMTA